MLYVDTSVVVRALLVDEEGHREARDLFIQHTRVVTARWTRLEAVAAIMRAWRDGRFFNPSPVMDQLVQGILASVIVLDPRPVMYDVAENAVRHFQLKPMDAMHIGAAVDFGQLGSPGEPPLVRDLRRCPGRRGRAWLRTRASAGAVIGRAASDSVGTARLLQYDPVIDPNKFAP